MRWGRVIFALLAAIILLMGIVRLVRWMVGPKPQDSTQATLDRMARTIDSLTAATVRLEQQRAHVDTIREIHRTEYHEIRDSLLQPRPGSDSVSVNSLKRLAAACDSTLAADSQAIQIRDSAVAVRDSIIRNFRQTVTIFRQAAGPRRLVAVVGGGYDAFRSAPVAETGVELHLAGRWGIGARLSTLLSRPRADGERSSGIVALHYTF